MKYKDRHLLPRIGVWGVEHLFWNMAVVFAALVFILAAYNTYRHKTARTGLYVRWLMISALALMLLVTGWVRRGGTG